VARAARPPRVHDSARRGRLLCLAHWMRLHLAQGEPRGRRPNRPEFHGGQLRASQHAAGLALRVQAARWLQLPVLRVRACSLASELGLQHRHGRKRQPERGWHSLMPRRRDLMELLGRQRVGQQRCFRLLPSLETTTTTPAPSSSAVPEPSPASAATRQRLPQSKPPASGAPMRAAACPQSKPS